MAPPASDAAASPVHADSVRASRSGVGALVVVHGSSTPASPRWMTPGDVLGRHHRCALAVPDPRLSEAHAMLSLRGRAVHLLNLRGGLRVDGRPVRDPCLRLGTRIEVAPEVFLEVVDIVLPDALWVLVGPGIDAPLERACSLVLTPRPHLRDGHAHEAAARFWPDGRIWHQAGVGPLSDGAVVNTPGWTGRLEHRLLEDAGVQPTRADRQELRIESRFDTVQIFRGDVHALSIGGITARILHELAELDGPVEWSLVARTVWRHDPEDTVRRRWDKRMSRLRAQLREAGLRDDLVRASGSGQVELLTYAGDTVHVLD